MNRTPGVALASVVLNFEEPSSRAFCPELSTKLPAPARSPSSCRSLLKMRATVVLPVPGLPTKAKLYDCFFATCLSFGRCRSTFTRSNSCSASCLTLVSPRSSMSSSMASQPTPSSACARSAAHLRAGSACRSASTALTARSTAACVSSAPPAVAPRASWMGVRWALFFTCHGLRSSRNSTAGAWRACTARWSAVLPSASLCRGSPSPAESRRRRSATSPSRAARCRAEPSRRLFCSAAARVRSASRACRFLASLTTCSASQRCC
mmetsp:Transcript_35045/g.76604  ORF Transcript_35045/g.76604 Transcript_35045/m.76604 type:complete len:265 (+) Transcript_35045:568-1362(+)